MVDMYQELDHWATEKALAESIKKRKRALMIRKQKKALHEKIAHAENVGDSIKAKMYRHHLTKFCKWKRRKED